MSQSHSDDVGMVTVGAQVSVHSIAVGLGLLLHAPFLTGL